MTCLLDVNLLVALAWPNHLHHDPALDWFQDHQMQGWATCSVTQSGFVRLSSNRRVLPEAVSPAEAIALLHRITELPGHQFWTDDLRLTSEWVDGSRLIGHRQITDAHLLGLALRHGGRLATLDAGIRHVVPRPHSAEQAICLVLAT